MYYDLVIGGSSFASIFYLKKILENTSENFRVAVLEVGSRKSHSWQLANRRQSELDATKTFSSRGLPEKDWVFSLGVGGSSNCWSACTPRMLPNDFLLNSFLGIFKTGQNKYRSIDIRIFQRVRECGFKGFGKTDFCYGKIEINWI